MHALTNISTTLATQVFPALSSAGVVEVMNVSRIAAARGAMGSSTASGSTSTPYTNIPVKVITDKKGGRFDQQGKPVALQTYILKFPTVTTAGVLIDINLATDKLIVAARSPFPARTYRIVNKANDSEVVNEFVCVLED